MKLRHLLQRVFSSKAGPTSLPASVYELLHSGIPLQVQKIAGAGRGLVATRDLEYGEILFTEQPYLCVPALSKRKQVCYHCLKVLQQTGGQQQQQQPGAAQQTTTTTVHTRGGAFCSQACLAAAQASYYILESQVNLSHLDQYCEASNERFPLLAARLALMVAQQAVMPQAEAVAAALSSPADRSGIARFSTGSSSSAGLGPLNTSSYMSSASSSRGTSRQASGIGRLSALSALSTSSAPVSSSAGLSSQAQDPSAPLSFLCFANVPPPPPAPWRESHRLLMEALQSACNTREDPQEGDALAAALASLDIDWYVSVLARLHLNTFKVDAVLPLDWGNAYAAAAAMLQRDGSSGSALYLLASLFNHSCEPCVNVTFPHNDGTAVFTAARRISAGEQLYITYTDTEQEVDVRQEFLAFSYGFQCPCPKCREEIAELSKHVPPHLQ